MELALLPLKTGDGNNELERAIMEKLLDGDHPALVKLREQYSHLQILKRELTGVGFFTDFLIPDHVQRVDFKDQIVLTDVGASMPSLEHGAGFALFIQHGQIEMLEGFTYDEPWPEDVGGFELSYDKVSRDLSKLREVT